MKSNTPLKKWNVRDRPAWVILSMAMPLGITLNFLSTWKFSQLSDVILAFLTTLVEPSRFQEGLVGMTVSLGIPTLIVFLLLKFTRMGVYLAPNRLTLVFMLLFDGVIVSMGTFRLYMLSSGQWPHLSGSHKVLAEFALAGSLIAALALLVLSTIWKRTDWAIKGFALSVVKWLSHDV